MLDRFPYDAPPPVTPADARRGLGWLVALLALVAFCFACEPVAAQDGDNLPPVYQLTETQYVGLIAAIHQTRAVCDDVRERIEAGERDYRCRVTRAGRVRCKPSVTAPE